MAQFSIPRVSVSCWSTAEGGGGCAGQVPSDRGSGDQAWDT